eukprot:scaffold119857_cov63-Phaeocystis_antarctica.AAC.2
MMTSRLPKRFLTCPSVMSASPHLASIASPTIVSSMAPLLMPGPLDAPSAREGSCTWLGVGVGVG